MVRENSLTIPELAKKLGISRVAAWSRIKKGEIPAVKVGRQYVVSARDARIAAGEELGPEHRRWLAGAVARVVREYGPTLKRLSRE